MLMAVIIGAGVLVSWMGLVYWTNQSYAARVPAPIEIIEVYGGGGGTPEGEPDSTEQIDVSDAEMAAFASNTELQPADFEEPSLMETPSAMLDALNEVVDQFADMPEEMRTGGQIASGQRSSKIGTGGPAYGFGAGDGGVPREQRWSIIYNPGQTQEEYARQLDFLGVEMATVINDQMHYASQFSAATPKRRAGSGRGDNRLYFLWQGAGRRTSDIALMKKAGIDVGRDGAIFQFYPQGVEEQLAQLEVRYKGLQPSEVRTTRFTVVAQGRGYAFQVIDQQPLN
ncbi:hypothetical protein BH23PLA1_BH23PLA1_29490 [soil metagenome]